MWDPGTIYDDLEHYFPKNAYMWDPIELYDDLAQSILK
jgi:hypothetical protein